MRGISPVVWAVPCLLALLAAGCGGAPVVPEPAYRSRAFDAELAAARQHNQGHLADAARGFAEALRLFVAVDDATGVARNRLHLARNALARAIPAEALDALAPLPEGNAEVLQLRAQAHLGLGRLAEARSNLQNAAATCAAPCPSAPALQLLFARVALAEGRTSAAADHARAAKKLLKDAAYGDDGRQSANADRMLAIALLNSGDAFEAEVAVRQAIEFDRQLALPEKLARDWLLLGDIRKKAGSGATAAPLAGSAADAYHRARAIASAAGLQDLQTAAEAALSEETPR